MSEKKSTTSFEALAAKGDGVLVKRGDVWTYPTAEMDGSGTNLRLPVEYVTDTEVQEALRSGGLNPVTTLPSGAVMSVRVKGDGEAPAAISVAQAGTPEAGTELPHNSRPSHDAGMKRMTQGDAERLAVAQARPVRAAEGAERPAGNAGHKGR